MEGNECSWEFEGVCVQENRLALQSELADMSTHQLNDKIIQYGVFVFHLQNER